MTKARGMRSGLLKIGNTMIQIPKKTSNFWFISILFILFALAAAAVILMLFVGINNVEKFQAMGQWGDFFGGSLNPILTFLTFVGLLFTIALQRIELTLTRDEMKRSADALELQEKAVRKQSFEDTFFGMLNLHNSIVNSIDLTDPVSDAVVRGRDCFRSFYTNLNKEYRSNLDKSGGKYTDIEILNISYENFWKKYQLELGHYIRYLFNIIRFVDQSDQAEPYHMKLVRAQLSDQELLLLFYNCTQARGKKFKILAEKHALFDNLPTVRLLNNPHANLVERTAFGDNDMKTGTDIRRKQIAG